MGRELKRMPLGFKWPMKAVWKHDYDNCYLKYESRIDRRR